MLGEQALALIRDVFEQPHLLRNLHRIDKRVVAWEFGAGPLTVDHSAVVVSEEALLADIRPLLTADCTPLPEPLWTVFAAQPLPGETVEHRFGSRTAYAVEVTLKDSSDPAACRIESVDNGWLFLVPNSPQSGWLLAVGDLPEVLLGQSRMIAPEIAHSGTAATGAFPAYARIVSPLCGPGWLACGTAAMAFDPICGDGTAHAVREAILASAVIRALASGGAASDLLSHYEARLTAGFRRHLAICRGFYQTGGTTPPWRLELDAIDRGNRWCDAQLNAGAGFRYRLRGFELEAAR
jgi:hypothetical protein